MIPFAIGTQVDFVVLAMRAILPVTQTGLGKLRKLDPKFPRQVETVTDLLLEHLKVTRGKFIPIYFHPRIYEARRFYGTIEDFESKVDIFYDLNRTRCWKRFIAIKELCQLLYGSSDNLHLSSSVEAIDSLLGQILAGIAMDEAASSEEAAILMAIEVLLPHSERPNVSKMTKNKSDAIMTIANHYLIPAQMVPTFLHSNYSDISEKVAQNLAAK
jgi:hypothetical protein